MEKQHDIKFKPLSDGLGLNHFADGLPYAPSGAKRRPTVHFDFPPPRAPRTSERAPDPVPAAQNAQTQAQSQVQVQPSAEPRTANFLRRIVAFGLDVGFVAAMFTFIVWASFRLNGFDLTELLGGRRGLQIFWPLFLLYVVVHLGYFLVQETSWRCTLGKALLGIRIRSSSGFSTMGRAVCFFIAAIPFGVGLFWYFFDSRRRCWHDVITDTEVVCN